LKVLVTGARSLMGAELVRRLLARGDHVTVLQRRPAGLGCAEVLADVADHDSVAAAARGHEVVVHLAARVGITGSWPEFLRTNVAGTRSVVGGCRAAGVRRLVHVSSPSVAHAGAPLVGEGAGPADPDGARGRYARSKALAEQVALAADGPDLAVLALRPHLVWGPGDTQLVGRTVARARAGRLVLIGSGAALVDTTYLPNAVDALVAAVDAPAHGEPLVVSNGEPRPIAELVSLICAAAGVPGPRRHVPYTAAWTAGLVAEGVWGLLGRVDDPPITRFVAAQLATAHWFDQRRTREVLDWTPRVRLDDGFVALARAYGTA
jgi:2-alkyl-3-oxoalkanoate reductase